MGFPPLLVCRSRLSSAATDQGAVFVVEGGVYVRQIGASFGASTVETGSGVSHPVCRVIKFNGKLYAWTRNVIREYDPGTGIWTAVHTIADHKTTEQHAYHSGLYFAVVNGLPSIFGVYLNTTDNPRIILYDGTTWGSVGTGTGAGGIHYGPGFMFRGKLCLPTSINGNERHLMADPGSGSFAYFSSNLTDSNSRTAGCYFSFNGRLLGVFVINTAFRAQHLYEFTGGGQWNQLQTIATGANVSGENAWGAFAWATPTTAYVMILYHAVANVPLFRLYKLEPTGTGGPGTTFTQTDITNPVLPASLRTNVGVNHYIDGFVDNTIPGSPVPYIRLVADPEQAPSGARGSAVFQFVDENTEMISLGPGPVTSICWPHSNLGGGEYIWSDATELLKLDVVAERLVAINTGIRIYFRCRNGSSVTPRTIKWYFSELDIPNMAPCTLIASTVTGGASNTTSEITNVDDDGSILYEVDWDTAADGVSDPAKMNLVGTIE